MRLTFTKIATIQEMLNGNNKGHIVSKSQLDQIYKNDNNQFCTYRQFFNKCMCVYNYRSKYCNLKQ